MKSWTPVAHSHQGVARLKTWRGLALVLLAASAANGCRGAGDDYDDFLARRGDGG